MKVLGLIGGMSWESTVIYYQLINRRVRAKMGGLHSSRCMIHAFDFAEIARLQHLEKWEEAGALLGVAAENLKRAGACTRRHLRRCILLSRSIRATRLPH